MKRPSNHQVLRELCLDRDNLTCVKCGHQGKRRKYKIIKDKLNLIADHIIPLSLGGEHNLDNMQTLCAKCDDKKNRIDQSNIAKYKREVKDGSTSTTD